MLMPKQIVIGTEDRPVKYHNKVKYVIFECNNCHKQFAKQESYFRKQLKTRENACCFCSAGCRTTYHAKKNFVQKAYESRQTGKQDQAEPSATPATVIPPVQPVIPSVEQSKPPEPVVLPPNTSNQPHKQAPVLKPGQHEENGKKSGGGLGKFFSKLFG